MPTMQLFLLFQFTRHLKETLDRTFSATRCIQGFTEALLNRDLEIIKFPSGYLSELVSDDDFDTLHFTDYQ